MELSFSANMQRLWLGSNCWGSSHIIGFGRRKYSSTEERIAIDAFGELQQEFPDLRMLIVPRHPERFDEIAEH